MSNQPHPYRYEAVQAAQLPQLALALPALLSGDWSESALRTMLASAHQLRVLSADSGDAVAFAEYLAVVDECQLFNIAVLPKWQQQGLGAMLLRAVLHEARTQGLQQCLLEVREHNTAARRLYDKLGFKVVGKRKDYYPPLQPGAAREAALLYSLSL